MPSHLGSLRTPVGVLRIAALGICELAVLFALPLPLLLLLLQLPLHGCPLGRVHRLLAALLRGELRLLLLRKGALLPLCALLVLERLPLKLAAHPDLVALHQPHLLLAAQLDGVGALALLLVQELQLLMGHAHIVPKLLLLLPLLSLSRHLSLLGHLERDRPLLLSALRVPLLLPARSLLRGPYHLAALLLVGLALGTLPALNLLQLPAPVLIKPPPELQGLGALDLLLLAEALRVRLQIITPLPPELPALLLGLQLRRLLRLEVGPVLQPLPEDLLAPLPLLRVMVRHVQLRDQGPLQCALLACLARHLAQEPGDIALCPHAVCRGGHAAGVGAAVGACATVLVPAGSQRPRRHHRGGLAPGHCWPARRARRGRVPLRLHGQQRRLGAGKAARRGEGRAPDALGRPPGRGQGAHRGGRRPIRASRTDCQAHASTHVLCARACAGGQGRGSMAQP
mmetsp:Transcript_126893/g.353337  ORF Transcript_126893/g.353337 Transcript_126893/m.353337 type:complete len:455 (+) Transcript_126893:285-1649(+)